MFQLLEFEESLESLERQVSELKKRNEEVEAENDRRGRQEDESAAVLTSQKQQQDQQVSCTNLVTCTVDVRNLNIRFGKSNKI